jgi:hypothetical protein
MYRFALLTIICLAIVWAAPAVGEMYYWTDENGIRHYSNQAPPTGDVDYGSSSEIEYNAEADRERRARDVKAAEEMKKAGEAEAAEAAQKEAEAARAATEAERERLEAEKRSIEEDLYRKRRASRSRMQKGVQKVVEIDEQIEELEKTGGSAAEIEQLKARRRQLVEEFYRNSRRWKRGGQADLKEHQEIQEQLDALEKKE